METKERLIVDIARLERDGESFRGELAPEVVDWGLSENDYATPSGGLCYDLFVQRLGDEILVRGRAGQDFVRTCARCAGAFLEHLAESDVVLTLPLEDAEPFVDLTDPLRESILLHFPEHPVCRPDCRGLCPKCGADLNEGPCRCGDSGAADARWGELDRLTLQ